MKRCVIFIMISVLFLSVGCSKEKASKKEIDVKKEGLVKLLPENTELLIKMRSIETLYTHFSISETSAFNIPLPYIAETTGKIGFNPSKIDDVKSQGIDVTKEFGVAITDIAISESSAASNMTFIVYIPVTDGQKAIDTLKASIQKESPTVKISQDGSLTVFQEEGKSATGYAAVAQNYLLMALNPNGDAKPAIESAIKGGASLADAESYRDVASKVDAGQELFGYVNLAKIAAKNLDALKNMSKSRPNPSLPDITPFLAYLADYESAGAALDFDTPNLILTSVINLTAGSRSLKIWEGVKFDKNAVLGIAENPVLLASFSFNAAEYYAMINDALPENEKNSVKARLELVKGMFGIDLETEIINNFAGNLNFGIYDGANITMTDYNILFTANMKDEAAAKKLIDTLVPKLPLPQQSQATKATVGGVETYTMMAGLNQVYIGVKDRNIVAAYGKPMFEKAISGKAASGFAAKIAEKHLAETLQGDNNFLYLNGDELLKVYKNFSIFIQQLTPKTAKIQEIISQVEFLLMSSTLQGNTLFGECMINTRFTDPFFIEVAKLLQNF